MSLFPFGHMLVAASGAGTANDFIAYLIGLLQQLALFMLPLGTLFFFYQLIKFLRASADGKGDLGKSKDMMVWSALALGVMVGVWSIAGYVQKSIVGSGLRIDQNTVDHTPLPQDLPE